MDKQKQIEEMANDMLEYAMEYYPKAMSAFTEKTLREQFYLSYLGYAQYLIKAGYRKIPENAVVITNEKLELGEYKCEVQVMNMTRQTYNAVLKQTRKETAEKFAEKGKTVLVKAYDQYVANADRNEKAGVRDMWSYWNGEANTTQKSIDLMDETCKEITEGKE